MPSIQDAMSCQQCVSILFLIVKKIPINQNENYNIIGEKSEVIGGFGVSEMLVPYF